MLGLGFQCDIYMEIYVKLYVKMSLEFERGNKVRCGSNQFVYNNLNYLGKVCSMERDKVLRNVYS